MAINVVHPWGVLKVVMSSFWVHAWNLAAARRRFITLIVMLLALGGAAFSHAADPSKSEEDLQREAAIAEFTAKMKAANYPALFEQAAAEFNVPPDLLKGVAFAETRWEHLTWPPGETASPETGMPRPYGIMSLWDNEYFGHSLIEAARLIGKDPEELKRDPLTNMRGGAALLKKLYDEHPKPDGTTEQDIESWRYAVVKYCGIPEPDLSNRHGLDVYEFMNQGYNQYGIEWKAHPVNLGPMREEVKRIVAAEDQKRQERMKAEGLLDDPPPTPPKRLAQAEAASPAAVSPENSSTPMEVAATSAPPSGRNGFWWLVGVLLVVLIGSLLAWRRRPAQTASSKKK